MTVLFIVQFGKLVTSASEPKDTETGAKEGEAAVCKPVPKCSKTIQGFSTYHNLLSGVFDMPK